MENIAHKVMKQHLEAVGTLDAEVVVEDYASDAVLLTPEATYNGVEEIAEFYRGFLPSLKDFEMTIVKQEVKDNIAYLVWSGVNQLINAQLCTDTYIVVGGKIKYHTFAGVINKV